MKLKILEHRLSILEPQPEAPKKRAASPCQQHKSLSAGVDHLDQTLKQAHTASKNTVQKIYPFIEKCMQGCQGYLSLLGTPNV